MRVFFLHVTVLYVDGATDWLLGVSAASSKAPINSNGPSRAALLRVTTSVCVCSQRWRSLVCRSYISNSRAFVRKTSGLINSGGLTGESSQAGVVSEINLHRKR